MKSRGRTALASLVLSLAFCRPTSLAQEGVGTAPQDAPEDSETASPRPHVLFLEPEAQSERIAELRDALLAQFAQLPAELLFEWLPASSDLLTERMSSAQHLAVRHDAIAVVWLEPQVDGRWLVYMLDTQNTQIIVRPIEAGAEQRQAAIEAVAVIVRESTRALLEGEPVAAAPAPQPALPPAPPLTRPPAPPRPEPAPTWRLWGGYAGTDFAPQVTLQHGARLGVNWLAPKPLYAGLSYLITAPLEPRVPVGITVQRFPFAAFTGARYALSKLALDAELGVCIEVLRRHAEAAGPVSQELTLATRESDTRVLAALLLRGQGEFFVLRNLGLYASFGVDILLSNFEYVARFPETDEPVLQPRTLRPMAELGLAFYP